MQLTAKPEVWKGCGPPCGTTGESASTADDLSLAVSYVSHFMGARGFDGEYLREIAGRGCYLPL